MSTQNLEVVSQAVDSSSNPKIADPKLLDKTAIDFLTKSTELGLMCVQLGNLAIDKGTIADVKAFGSLMVKEHTSHLTALKKLAENKKFTLPSEVNRDEKKQWEGLKSKTGVDFNKKFVAQMIFTNKQALKIYKSGSQLKDHELAAFAGKQIHNINLHLLRINQIKDKMN